MIYLLDTGAFAWMLVDSQRLSKIARVAIQSPHTELTLSAASLFEISTKVRLGKWPEMEVHESGLLELVSSLQIGLLAITGEVAMLAARLSYRHKDPFDRLIGAQALKRNLPLISPDREFDGFGVRRIW